MLLPMYITNPNLVKWAKYYFDVLGAKNGLLHLLDIALHSSNQNKVISPSVFQKYGPMQSNW